MEGLPRLDSSEASFKTAAGMAVRDALERLLTAKRGQILGFEPGERPGWDRVVALATVGLGTFTVRHERFEVAPERTAAGV